MARHSSHSIEHPVFHEPVFGDQDQGQDPLGFDTPHGSDTATYKQIQDALKRDVVGFEKSKLADDAVFPLTQAYGSRGEAVQTKIIEAKRIVFHAVGDTGSSDVRKYKFELRVADQLSIDCQVVDPANRPAFLFHLGDVVYSFGESRYYFDQFYEPFRSYAAPIFAIPGNHDSFIVPGTATADEPLKTFSRNFCSSDRVITPEAGSLHRTAMTQPGVYFALDAPFVRIIALFSNSLEDPGVISSQDGKWQNVPDYQLDFLSAQLKKIKAENYSGAVILASHHPAFSYSPPPHSGTINGNHSSSSAMLRQIDEICKAEEVYPHAFLAAHAHCYQRYTRTVQMGEKEFEVPFVLCGNGGHNVNPLVRSTRTQPAQEPENGSDVSYLDRDPAAKGLILEKYDDHDYGYLRISVDAQQLRIAYHQAGVRSLLQSRFDLVTVDLASHALVAN